MSDHDQRIKTLLREFLADFFKLFLPDWAERFDFEQVEWLDKEAFLDPPQGERRVLDLVCKLRLRRKAGAQRKGDVIEWIALIHIEIESGVSVAAFRPRMYEYFEWLRRRHHLPVLPIGLYLNVGLDGIGHDVFEETLFDLPVLRFEYLYVGLPALDAEAYIQSDNPLAPALAALMRVPADRKAWLKAEALRKIAECPENNWRKFLLCECLGAYMPLDESQTSAFDALLDSKPYQGAKAMAVTWYEQGIEKGIEKGVHCGQVELLRCQLEDRFGILSETILARLEAMPAEQLKQLSRALLKAASLKELGLE